ncbi:erg24, C-14 sterol reductase [Orbilia oligospora]|nr:erg24, C-14 sterol reductase [Orbilia oligospora]
MVLVNVFQFWYIFDAFWNEPSILTTMDITSDGFGYMLSFGDLAWVPFTYSLQGRYLAMYPLDLGITGVVGVLLVKGIGYYIFRGANAQKNAFRTNPEDPSLKHLKYIETKTGRKLLISGWWGMSRHINYLGDWVMGWAWCLPTGFGTWVTYFYVGYFAVLLINRERRDDSHCRTKYGEDWKRYTSIVKSRIVPGIY